MSVTNQPLREAVLQQIGQATRYNQDVFMTLDSIMQLFLAALDDLEKMAVPEKEHDMEGASASDDPDIMHAIGYEVGASVVIDEVHAGFDKFRKENL